GPSLPDTAAGHRGKLSVGGTSVVTYAGAGQVGIAGAVSNVAFNLPAGDGDNEATLEDDASETNNTSRLRSGNGTFATTAFVNPDASLTVNTGGDGETVTVA